MIETQIQLEKEMLDHGIQRYRNAVDNAEENGRGSQTSYASRLIPELCAELADSIEGFKSVSKGRPVSGRERALMRDVDSNQLAFMTLKCVFDTLIKTHPVTQTAADIGMRVEDEIRFSRFRGEHEAYYQRILDQFKERNTMAYRHMHRVLTSQANKKEDGWNSWTQAERVKVGAVLIELVIKSTGLIEKRYLVKNKKQTLYLVPNEELMQWIEEHMNAMELMFPDFGPCVIPPRDWISQREGGYFTEELQRRVEFIKIKDKHHRKAIKGNNYDMAMQGVNAMQRTAWRINTGVHDVMKEVWGRNLRIGMPASEPFELPDSPFPGKDPDTMTVEEKATFVTFKRQCALIHTKNNERISKSISLLRTMQMANKYREFKEFFYVYNCDFRGRVYASASGLTPQGADFSKALLEFSTGKPIGLTGGRHLGIHGANSYGEDKMCFDERVRWVYRNDALIRRCAIDPFDSTAKAFWANADKPYSFLAFCFEWAGYRDSGESSKFITHLPIAADGTCNGIQNFSAMLRDPIGAVATNLTGCLEPQDIYQRVADVLSTKLSGQFDDDVHRSYAAGWQAVGITRKLTKKPVMTLPYGSTLASAVDSIEDYLIENPALHKWEGVERRNASAWLGKLMWTSIGEVVIAARQAMDWIQKASRVCTKFDTPMTWTTPTGFYVYQGTRKFKSDRVRTQICGEVQLKIATALDEFDPYKQANGSAPNFVHSMDASHMCTTLVYASALGITDFHMIHDSFGTYACDMDEFHKCIREAFVDLYADKNILMILKAQLDGGREFVLADPPSMGSFDINEVVDAEYFFG